jgi:hypothetical protein
VAPVRASAGPLPRLSWARQRPGPSAWSAQAEKRRNCLHHFFFLARGRAPEWGGHQPPRARRAASCAAVFYASMAPAPPTTSLYRARTALRQQPARRGRPPPGRWGGGVTSFSRSTLAVHFWKGTREDAHQCVCVFATRSAAWELGGVAAEEKYKGLRYGKKRKKKEKKKLPCGLDVPTPRACPPPPPYTLCALPRMLKDLSYPWGRVRCPLASKMTGRRCRGRRRLQTNKQSMAYAGSARACTHTTLVTHSTPLLPWHVCRRSEVRTNVCPAPVRPQIKRRQPARTWAPSSVTRAALGRGAVKAVVAHSRSQPAFGGRGGSGRRAQPSRRRNPNLRPAEGHDWA